MEPLGELYIFHETRQNKKSIEKTKNYFQCTEIITDKITLSLLVDSLSDETNFTKMLEDIIKQKGLNVEHKSFQMCQYDIFIEV